MFSLILQVHWFRKQSLQVLYKDEFGRHKSKSLTPETSGDIAEFRESIIKTAETLQEFYKTNHVSPAK